VEKNTTIVFPLPIEMFTLFNNCLLYTSRCV